MIISISNTYIHYVSNCYVGKTHDYSLLKEEFPSELPWFKNFEIRVDLGYQGLANDYDCQKVIIPDKKPKGEELSLEQKSQNKQQSQKCIYVEHSIGGMKRYRILSDILRVHDVQLYNDVLEVGAGLWNFNVKY